VSHHAHLKCFISIEDLIENGEPALDFLVLSRHLQNDDFGIILAGNLEKMPPF